MKEGETITQVPASKVEFSGQQVTLEIAGEQTRDYPVVFL